MRESKLGILSLRALRNTHDNCEIPLSNGKAPAVLFFPYEFTGHSWNVAVHNPDDQ